MMYLGFKIIRNLKPGERFEFPSASIIQVCFVDENELFYLFQKFTAAQLEFFSSNQVQAMTDSQREALNEEQLNAVNRVMTTITGGLNSQGLKSAGK